MKRLLLVGFLLSMLVGCAAPPPLNFSVPNVGYTEKKLDAELRSMSVTLARPDEVKGEMPWGAEELPAFWERALKEAVDRMAIFRDNAEKKVNLAVKILGMDIPGGGFSFTTKAIARYELIDRSNGDIIYTQDIESEGYVPMDHAFLGVTRSRESVNRSAQNNISQFLQALETVDLNRPMFPRSVAAAVAK